TVNCATTHLRRRAKTSHDRLEDLVDPRHLVDPRLAWDPEATAGSRDERSRLVEALAELPDQLRLVVVLRDVYDLPHREIALELGISQSAAKVRLHRARRRLRERLFPARHAVVGAPGDPTTAPPGAMTAGPPGAMTAGPPGAMTAAPRAGCLVAEAGSPRDGSLQDKAGAA
ncbi:MAG: RNA polymerase sigma factor, partial [Acidimicrobiales bacterium]